MLRNVVEQASEPVPGRTGPVDLDIIIPVFNEELGIENLFTRLETAFDASVRESHQIKSVRLLLVDDGSTDGTAARIASALVSRPA